MFNGQWNAFFAQLRGEQGHMAFSPLQNQKDVLLNLGTNREILGWLARMREKEKATGRKQAQTQLNRVSHFSPLQLARRKRAKAFRSCQQGGDS
jgi:hypothetical protein